MEFFGDMISTLKRLLLRLRMHHIFLSPERLVHYEMLRERDGAAPRNFAALSAAGQQGLVSIILPVYNGERYLREAIDSVCAQTYTDWELIVVDDGSTDASATIVQEYADNDARIRLVRQENKKLPAALNTGHRAARGEFLTWTSDDNRLKPDFLTVLVAEMQQRPSVDMLFANLQAIDAAGGCATNAPYYAQYQYPPGSGTIRLPVLVSRLHAWNSIGAAFLYRRRILPLVGLYSENWFTCEDYDFWLRVNLNAVLRHSHHLAPLYQYRVHGASLTAASHEMRISQRDNALRVFHDSRRDILSGPIAWIIVSEETQECQAMKAFLVAKAKMRGDLLLQQEEAAQCQIPLCLVCITADAHRPLVGCFPEKELQHCACLLYMGREPLPEMMDAAWDLCLGMRSPSGAIADLGISRGWLVTEEQNGVWHALRARAGASFCTMLKDHAFRAPESHCKISAVICTNRAPAIPMGAVASLAQQSLDSRQYEIVLVNNDPLHQNYDALTQLEVVQENAVSIRVVNCTPAGLSVARNRGLMAARGEIVLYIDDDALVDETCLAHIVAAYEMHENVGVVGGSIVLEPPNPEPWWYGKDLAGIWSEFLPEQDVFYECTDWRSFPFGALWSARRQALLEVGGFRTRYGRNGRTVQAAEEIVTALSLQSLGYRVAVEPQAKVRHIVSRDRFSFRGLYKTILYAYESILLMQMEKRIPPILHLHKCPLRGLVRLLMAAAPLPIPIAQRSRNLVFGMVQFRCTFLLMKNLGRRIAMRPAEWRDAP